MQARADPPPRRDRRRQRSLRRYLVIIGLLTGLALAPAAGQALRGRGAGPATADAVVAAAPGATASAARSPAVAGHVATRRAAGRPADADDPPAHGAAGRPADADLPEFTHRSARLEDVSRTPVALRIDALDLDAPVLATGRAADGQLDVPPDAGTVVWYRAGSIPGAAGSAVLAAHVDYDGRPGAFYALDRLRPGDTARVEFDDGSTLTFEVVDRTRYRKQVLPITELFTRNGDAGLALVTCGGRFNKTARRYDSNTVVRAELR